MFNDDLHKRYIDRHFLSLTEDWEVTTFEKDVKAQRPLATSEQIHAALLGCAKLHPRNHPRAKVMECVLAKV